MDSENKVKILFVCLGNICRSPAAEGIMTHLVNSKGVADKFLIDSAGTYGGNAGKPADYRMKKHAAMRGYDLTSISRKIKQSDFYEFDWIVAMDDDNYEDLVYLQPKDAKVCKVVKMTSFGTFMNNNNVPDPYYGGDAGFELVLDILEQACLGMFQKVKN